MCDEVVKCVGGGRGETDSDLWRYGEYVWSESI